MRDGNLCLFRIEPVTFDERQHLRDPGRDGGDGEEEREDGGVVGEGGEQGGAEGNVEGFDWGCELVYCLVGEG